MLMTQGFTDLRQQSQAPSVAYNPTWTVYQYGLKQAFIRPHTPQQNGMVERLILTVKEQCLWLHNFQSLDEARQTLRAWFKYYNE